MLRITCYYKNNSHWTVEIEGCAVNKITGASRKTYSNQALIAQNSYTCRDDRQTRSCTVCYWNGTGQYVKYYYGMTGICSMNAGKAAEHSYPPGRIKISEALKELLGHKDFQAIKIAEIAETAGVNEALIYKYFKNKRDLLYQMVGEYLEKCRIEMINGIAGLDCAIEKLERFVSILFDIYNRDRIYAKMILFEFRNSSDFYTSKPFDILQETYDLCLDIIKEGIADCTFRKDINPCFMRHHIIGSVEQVCMNAIITSRPIHSKKMTAYIIDLLVNGIRGKGN